MTLPNGDLAAPKVVHDKEFIVAHITPGSRNVGNVYVT
jgi:hypothetical protein